MVAQFFSKSTSHLPTRMRQVFDIVMTSSPRLRKRVLPNKRALALIALIRLLGVSHWPACLHGRVHDANIEVDLDAVFACEIEVVVGAGDEQTTADDVAKEGGNE